MLFKKIQKNKTKFLCNTHKKLTHQTNKIIDLVRLSKSNSDFNLNC